MRTPPIPSLRADLPVVFSAAQQYQAEVAALPTLSREQEEVLIARARAGCDQARKALIESCLDYLRFWAMRSWNASGWQYWRLELEELIGWGNLFLVQLFERALQKEEPVGYLKRAARFAMADYAGAHRSAITTGQPDGHHRGPDLPVESLDVPLEEGSDLTLADVLEAPSLRLPSEEETFEALQRALSYLAPAQREALQRLYGLDDFPCEVSLSECARTTHKTHETIQRSRDDGLAKLRTLMPSPHLCPEVYTASQAYACVGVGQAQFNQLARVQGVQPCLRGLYLKDDVERIAHARMQRGTSKPLEVRA